MWGRLSPTSTSRGLLVSSKHRATAMICRPVPALRRPLLAISSSAPEPHVSRDWSRRSSGGRSSPISALRGPIWSSNDCATSTIRRPVPALRRAQLPNSSFAPETRVSHGPCRRSLWGRSWSASMSRGLLVSSKELETSMRRRPRPALRRAPLLTISSFALETSMSHGLSSPSLRGRW